MLLGEHTWQVGRPDGDRSVEVVLGNNSEEIVVLLDCRQTREDLKVFLRYYLSVDGLTFPHVLQYPHQHRQTFNFNCHFPDNTLCYFLVASTPKYQLLHHSPSFVVHFFLGIHSAKQFIQAEFDNIDAHVSAEAVEY
jgi:hypothetical protein